MLYSWTFINKKNRGKMWYIIAFSVLIGLVIWGFLTQQYGLSFVLLLLAGLTFYIENNSTDEIYVEISELGIRVADGFYDYSKIQSYSFIYSGDEAVFIRLRLIQKGLSIIDLDVNNNIVIAIKEILPSFIEENIKEELNTTDKIIKFFKL